jgi:hypothetical protein
MSPAAPRAAPVVAAEGALAGERFEHDAAQRVQIAARAGLLAPDLFW